MKVRVRLYGRIKSKIGLRELTVDLGDGGNLENLLRKLEAEYASMGIRGEDFEDMAILINGCHVSDSGGCPPLLSDGDVVSILPHLAGG